MLTDYYRLLNIYSRADGGFSGVSYTHEGAYRGFIQPIGGGENFRNGKGGEFATHRLYTNLSTPCRYGYKVIDDTAQEYIMLYAIQPHGISAVNHHKEIILGVFE